MRGLRGAGSLALPLLAAALLNLAVATVALAAATPSRVVVLARTDDADDVTGEALARVSGELTAAGFDVRAVRVPSSADPRATVESVGRDLSPAAAFAIFPGAPTPDGRPSAEIWVSDRLTGRATVEHLSVDPRDADRRAAVLAVRAVELLKASVAELWVGDSALPGAAAPGPPSSPPPPKDVGGATTAVRAAPAVPATRLVATDSGTGLEAATAIVGHVGGFPPDVAPMLRLSVGVGRRLAVRLDAFGLDRGWTLTTADGTARVRMQLATANVVMTFRQGRRLQGRRSAGLGAARVDVTGTGNGIWIGQSKDVWTGMGGAGAGAAAYLTPALAVVAELDAELFWHRPAVSVGSTIPGQVGAPALLGTLGLRFAL